MGTPLPPNEVVTGCALCFGFGNPLGLVQPKFVYVHFEGTQQGDSFDLSLADLPNGTWRLAHVTGCVYRYTDSQRQIILNWGASRTFLTHQVHTLEADLYHSALLLQCSLSWVPERNSPVGVFSFGGKLSVTWPTEGLS